MNLAARAAIGRSARWEFVPSCTLYHQPSTRLPTKSCLHEGPVPLNLRLRRRAFSLEGLFAMFQNSYSIKSLFLLRSSLSHSLAAGGDTIYLDQLNSAVFIRKSEFLLPV